MSINRLKSRASGLVRILVPRGKISVSVPRGLVAVTVPRGVVEIGEDPTRTILIVDNFFTFLTDNAGTAITDLRL